MEQPLSSASAALSRGLVPLQLFFLAQGAKVNPQLLAFLVQVTALEAERFGGVGDVIVVVPQLRQNRLALEALDSLRQGAEGGRR